METTKLENRINCQGPDFMAGFNRISGLMHEIAAAKGFWPKEADRNQAEMICLMHSELSEALEAIRNDLPSDHLENYTGIEEELADCIIRIMDFAVGFELDVAGAIIEKAKFNLTRPHKHGKKF